MMLVEIKGKTIFTKTRLPGVSYVINQYVGCDHLCLYCYARFIGQWKKYGKWGTWVEAKVNAPELVKDKYVRGHVWMSSVSDPYQNVEKTLKLTRRVLINMDKKIDLAIQTKSNLVLRDIDLFKEFKNIEIGMTVNGFAKKAKKLLEPFSASHKTRLETLKKLKEEGIKTYAFVSPIIPGLVDVEKVISQTKQLVDYYFFETINLKGAGRGFATVLEREFPDTWEIIKDKEKFKQFVGDVKLLVKKAKVKSRGVFVH